MSDDDIDRLTQGELLVLAGLVRKLVRADGQFSQEEHEAIARMARRVGTPDAQGSVGEEKLHALIAQAADTYPDDEAIRTAAIAIERPEARAIIHAHLFDVAASDSVSHGESTLLDWLEDEWELQIVSELEGESTNVG